MEMSSRHIILLNRLLGTFELHVAWTNQIPMADRLGAPDFLVLDVSSCDRDIESSLDDSSLSAKVLIR